MVGVIQKASNSSFQKDMTFCRIIHVKKVMTLLSFIFEQPSYVHRYVKSDTEKFSLQYLQQCHIMGNGIKSNNFLTRLCGDK